MEPRSPQRQRGSSSLNQQARFRNTKMGCMARARFTHTPMPTHSPHQDRHENGLHGACKFYTHPMPTVGNYHLMDSLAMEGNSLNSRPGLYLQKNMPN